MRCLSGESGVTSDQTTVMDTGNICARIIILYTSLYNDNIVEVLCGGVHILWAYTLGGNSTLNEICPVMLLIMLNFVTIEDITGREL